jgi:hypothetical protein
VSHEWPLWVNTGQFSLNLATRCFRPEAAARRERRAGQGWTLARICQVSDLSDITLETLEVHPNRPVWSYDDLPVSHVERQIQLTYRCVSGIASHTTYACGLSRRHCGHWCQRNYFTASIPLILPAAARTTEIDVAPGRRRYKTNLIRAAGKFSVRAASTEIYPLPHHRRK